MNELNDKKMNELNDKKKEQIKEIENKKKKIDGAARNRSYPKNELMLFLYQ